MSKVFKLTPSMLRRLVKEEKNKLILQGVKAEEVDAGGYAKSLEHHINWIKALKIKEAKLKEATKKVQIARQKLTEKIKGA